MIVIFIPLLIFFSRVINSQIEAADTDALVGTCNVRTGAVTGPMAFPTSSPRFTTLDYSKSFAIVYVTWLESNGDSTVNLIVGRWDGTHSFSPSVIANVTWDYYPSGVRTQLDDAGNMLYVLRRRGVVGEKVEAIPLNEPRCSYP